MDGPTRISKEDVRRRLDAGESLVILDTRSPASWAESDRMISGAVRVPADQVEENLDRIPEGRTVVTYCT